MYFSFFRFLDCFLDLLRESLLLELLRLRLEERDDTEEAEDDEDEDDDEEDDDELEEDDEEDLLRLRFRFFFSRPVLLDLLLRSDLELELDTMHSALVDIARVYYGQYNGCILTLHSLENSKLCFYSPFSSVN